MFLTQLLVRSWQCRSEFYGISRLRVKFRCYNLRHYGLGVDRIDRVAHDRLT
ncbi:MAG: hypothetical protein RLZZ135_1062 [Cyanobacteriota bacterium]|jgi:hypothetical protein